MQINTIMEALPVRHSRLRKAGDVEQEKQGKAEAKEELEQLKRDQESTSSSSPPSLGEYVPEDEVKEGDTIIGEIRQAYSSNAQANGITHSYNPDYRVEHDLVYYNSTLLVPNDIDIKEKIMKMCHDFE